jgi:5-methylcytosine-specific restriction endonuclease McrA
MSRTSKYFDDDFMKYRYKQKLLPNQIYSIQNNENECKLYCNDLNVIPSNHVTFENIITKTPYKKGTIYKVLYVGPEYFIIDNTIQLKSYEQISWKLYVEPIQEVKVEQQLNPIKIDPIKIDLDPIKIELKKIKKSLPTAVKDCIWNYYIGQHINIHKCFCCKKNIIKIDDFHAGHVVAEAQGGGDDIGNLRPICSSCNSSMGKRDMVDYVKQYGLYLISPINQLYIFSEPSNNSSIPKAIRSQLWGIYISEYINEHTCCCCKKIRITIKNFEIGHVISKKNGGSDDIQNLRPICAVCKHISNDDIIETIKKYEYYI